MTVLTHSFQVSVFDDLMVLDKHIEGNKASSHLIFVLRSLDVAGKLDHKIVEEQKDVEAEESASQIENEEFHTPHSKLGVDGSVTQNHWQVNKDIEHMKQYQFRSCQLVLNLIDLVSQEDHSE